MQASITCFAPDGSTFDWRPIWARFPEFLQTYPPSEGWRVVLRTSHLLDVTPSMFKLAKLAMEKGMDLQSIGLTNAELTSYVTEAQLVDPNGHVVRSASARNLAPAASSKAWERGETAALNRLMAMLGYAGHLLAQDEAHDRMVQGITVQSPEGGSQPQPAIASSGSAYQSKPSSSGRKTVKKGAELSDDGVSRAMRTFLSDTIETLANRGIKVTIPELHTNAQAQEFLAELEEQHGPLKETPEKPQESTS